MPRPAEGAAALCPTGDDEPAWQIVARYDPLRSVRVVIP